MQLIRKEIVQKESPKNIYRLTIRNMSVYGECYKDLNHFFESEIFLLKVVKLLYSIWTDLDNSNYFDDECIEMIMNNRGSELGFINPLKTYIEYVGTDISEVSKYAALEMMKISFFDVWGTEYMMELQDNKSTPFSLNRTEVSKNNPWI